jgi:hypothetical protein
MIACLPVSPDAREAKYTSMCPKSKRGREKEKRDRKKGEGTLLFQAVL